MARSTPATSATIEFDVTINAPAAGQDVVNQAAFNYIAQTLNKPFTFNTNTVTTPVDPVADLSIVKSASPAPFVAGSTATYTLTVTNGGPSPAPNVNVTDVLPPAFSAATVTTSVGTCGISAGTVGCSLGTLANGAVATVTVSAPLAAALDPTSVLNNTATVTGSVTDPVDSNNSSTVSSPVVARADLAISKTASPTTATAGQPITYTISVANGGPSVARNVQVTDVLPPTLSGVVLAPSAGGSCSGTTCTFPTIDAAGSATVTVTGTVGSSATGTIVNRATASSPTPDPTSANNNVERVTPVATSADLQVAKSASPSPAVPGDGIEYTITVFNAGPSDAAAVTLTDPLTALAGVAASASTGTCAVTGSVDCTIGTVRAGETVTVTISGTVDAARTTDLTNTATASSSTSDPNGSNNSGSVVTTMQPSADLSITKTASPNPLIAGDEVTYTVTVVNNGPSDATGVVVTDTPPGELDNLDGSASQGSCSATTCTLGTLAAGASATVIVTGDVPSGADPADVADNTAEVAADTVDPDPSDNTATISTGVAAVADLRLAKSASPSTVNAGESTVWTIVATNDGPSAADAFEIVDTLDTDLSPISATIGGTSCSIALQVVTCVSPGLAVGASTIVLITTTVAPSATAGTIANSASIGNATTSDPTSSNNTASSNLTVNRSADVSIVKTAVTDPITPGLPATFTLAISNAGPSTANAVAAADGLPLAWTLGAGSDPRCTLTSGTVGCDLGVLGAGASEVVTLVVVPPPGATTGPFTNTATVSSSTPDPTPGDNGSSDDATVVAVADLSITKTDLADPVIAGEGIGYELRVTNAGPSDAGSVLVDDSDLAGLDAVTLTPSQGTCETVTFTCDLGILPNAGVATITVSATVPEAAPAGNDVLSNTATVTSPDDPDSSDNTATETTSVERSADLVVGKSVSPLTATAGDPITWTITASNLGPSVASDVSLTDSLPAGLVAATVMASSDRGTCVVGATDVACGGGSLLPGDTVTVTITAQVDPAYSGANLSNTATASSSDPDDNPSDNTATVVVPAQSAADLTIDKNPSKTAPVAGESLDWVIQVYNDGPSTALDVDVVDVLPAGFAVTSVSSTPSGCSSLPCALGDLPVGALVTIVVTGTVDPSSLGDISNTATVSSSTDDPNPSDNTSEATARATALADLSITKTGVLTEFVPGQTASWTIEVTNGGPSDATDVTVTDTLPSSGLSGVTSTPSQGSCATPSSCQLGTLAAGSSATITVSGTLSSGYTAADITNAASVTSATFDPAPGDETASSTVPVVPVADLSILKLAVDEPFVPGAPVRWSLTVTNNGPSAATAVTVDDTLPLGATISTATPTAGSCSGAGTRDLDCSLGSIAAGATVTIDLVADLAASVTSGTLGNTAAVDSATVDPNPTNNSSSDTATVAGSADLVLSKALTSPVTAGDPITWDLTVENTGPSDASSVSITDVVPVGVTLGALPPGCAGTDTIVCSVASLADGATASFSIVGTLHPDARGSFTNTATVAATTPDPDTDDNSSTASAPINVTSDVLLTKVAPSPVPVPGGAPGRWTVTLTNNGPSTANGVVIDDPIPNAVDAVIGSAGTLGSCDSTVTCTIGDLPPGTTVTVLVDVDYPADAAEGLTLNAATVTATSPLTGTTDATDSFVLTASADLSVSKTIIPDTFVTAGESATYRIVVSNAGPSDSTSVVLSDPLPAGALTPTLVDPGLPCDITGSALSCTFPTVAADQTIVVDVDFTVDAGVVGFLDNTVTLTSSTADPDGTDNSATVAAGVVTVADLSIDKIVTPGPQTAGDAPFEYLLTVTNAGPSDALAATVTDELPPGLAVDGAITTTVEADPYTCTVASPTITCVRGSAPAGSVSEIRIPVSIAPDAPAGPRLNSAMVSSTTTDPSLGNNTDAVAVPVVRATDVTFDKVADSAAVVAGETARWILSGEVNGPSNAEASTVSDTLPVGFTSTGAVLTVNGTVVTDGCTFGGRVIVCPLGDLDPGDTFEVVIDASIDPAISNGTVSNAANFSTITPGGTTTAGADVEIGRVSPIEVTKSTIGAGPFLAGEPLDWTVAITNPGPSTSTSIELTELAPTGYLVTGLEPSQGTCTLPATCSLGSLPVDGIATVTIRGALDPAASAGPLTNQVSVATGELAAPVVASGVATVAREASLRLTKTAAPVVAVAGGPLAWTVTLTNDGPSTADVTVSDTIAPELVGATITPSIGTTWSAPDWDVPALAPGATVTLAVSGTLSSSFTGASIANTATLVSDAPNPGNTTSTVTTPVNVEADLELAKRTITDPIVAGAPVTWEIDVTNNGPSDAVNVLLADTIPADIVPGSEVMTVAPSSAATCDAVTLICDFGTIAAGTPTTTVTITGLLAPDAVSGDDLINGAAISSDTPDPDPDDNAATATSSIESTADLTIVKRALTVPLVAGATADWEIEVTNNGPSDAADVVVTDTPPAELLDAEATSADADCTGLTCTVPTLPAGDTLTVTVTGTLAASIADGASITNLAEVTSPTDPATGTKTASALGNVATSADLTITKVAAATPVAGAPISWVITVDNAGPSDSADVVVTDTLPAVVTGTVLTPSQGTCTATGICNLGVVAADDAATITVTADLPADIAAGTLLENSAGVTSATTDPDLDGNVATASDAIAAIADVSVSIDAPPVVMPGSTIMWSVDLTNAGPSNAVNTVVTIPVPDGVTITGLDPDGPCVLVGSVITCTFGVLLPGDTTTLTFTGDTDPDGTEPIELTATAVSDTDDPDGTNNDASIAVARVPVAELSVTQSFDDDNIPYFGSTSLAVTIRNDGPSLARDVIVAHEIPAGLTVLTLPDGCSTDGTTITCDLGDLAAGESITIEFTVRGDTPGPIEVCSEIAASSLTDSGDSDITDDTSCATLTVGDAAQLRVTKSAGTAAATVGATVTWTVTVTNDGPSTARGVTVTERPGSGVTVQSATPSTGSYDVASATWSVGDLPAGSSATLEVRTTVSTAGSLTNSVDLASATPDAALARAGTPAAPIVTATSGAVTVTATSAPLASTGSDSGPIGQFAIVFVAVGLGLVLAGRRRGNGRQLFGV